MKLKYQDFVFLALLSRQLPHDCLPLHPSSAPLTFATYSMQKGKPKYQDCKCRHQFSHVCVLQAKGVCETAVIIRCVFLLLPMVFAVRVRSAGQKYGPTCHQRDRADVTEFVTLVRLSSLGQHVGVLALAGYKRRKSALTAGPIHVLWE